VVDPDEPTVDVPAGERGELIVRGPQVFQGYYGKPEATEQVFVDGWFRTGDIVQIDDDGFVRIVDRIKELIITGGFNVALPRSRTRCGSTHASWMPPSWACRASIPGGGRRRRGARRLRGRGRHGVHP
jgi:acyl-CoA synthetase (AMP-forming)/AMP-acid ligase II